MRTFLTGGLLATTLVAALAVSSPAQELPKAQQAAKVEATRPIDMVIVLDTSGSMENLIDSARSRIWSIVLKLSEAKPEPKLRIGLLTYGTPENSLEEDGWINKQIDLTDEIDEAYTKMMAMSTQGGDEFVGWALHRALRNMDWNDDPNALRLIYIAGNESADQAREVHDFREVAKEAAGRDVIINALYGGAPDAGVAEAWDKVPSSNGGDYFPIDMAAGTVQIATPFDSELERLNLELNATLIPYGNEGEDKLNAVVLNDFGAAQLGNTANTARIAAKACNLWCNTRWDLVDACAQPEFKLADMKEEDLPEIMREMSPAERTAYVKAMKDAREAVKAKIAGINKQRESYIARVRSLTEGTEQQSLDEAIMTSIAKQAKAKGFVIEVTQEVSTDADDAANLTPQEEIMFELAVDRLMWKLPRIEYQIGTYHTFEQEIAEQFAAATKLETVYQVSGESFAKLDDAQAALRAAIVREAGRMLQVQKVEREIEVFENGPQEIVEFHIAGQVLSDESHAKKVAEKVLAEMQNSPQANTPEDVDQQARKMFAAGLHALEELTSE